MIFVLDEESQVYGGECNDKGVMEIWWDLRVTLNPSIFSNFGLDDSFDHVLIEDLFNDGCCVHCFIG